MKHSKAEAIMSLLNKVPEFANKVQPIYKRNRYTWAGVGVPDVTRIESTLYSLIGDLERTADESNEKFHAVSTGRLCVELICWRDNWHGKMMMTAEWMDLD